MNSPTLIGSGIKNVVCGVGVKIIEPSNLYECELGDYVFVGPYVEIQSDVIVGENTKIQSHSFVCSMVEIGSDCFVGHGVMFVNDVFSNGGPARGDKSLWQSTTIGNNVSIGSNATILPVKICDNVVIGAGAVVTVDIESPGTYVGVPAKKLKESVA